MPFANCARTLNMDVVLIDVSIIFCRHIKGFQENYNQKSYKVRKSLTVQHDDIRIGISIILHVTNDML
jgi:hypothetical protein